ncbi:MAG: hypothetical protein A4E60_02702 [Syntrophorhabdus sp. PtaB.Bin047]|jgi:hypothetical protein|nr:MAG: hypothetical protein A4E60_02702 [Syntrophorhabdus sp. PtaB.Bin047]
MTLELQLPKVRGARRGRNIFVFLLVIRQQPAVCKWKMHRWSFVRVLKGVSYYMIDDV